jgi:NADH dehydrogenase (ubiquinone) 1 alpha subcomplex subunit 9
LPPSPGVLTYADLDIVPGKITEGMPMEPIRYSRIGGYLHGDTRKLAQKLPSSVKRFYGVSKRGVDQGLTLV